MEGAETVILSARLRGLGVGREFEFGFGGWGGGGGGSDLGEHRLMGCEDIGVRA